MGFNNQVENQISFEPVIENFENSLRGIVKNKNKKNEKVFPESAGSIFISKWISHLRTILIGTNTLSKLDSVSCRRRIKNNGEAFILGMIVDNTVDENNMTQLGEGFNNLLIDSYLGLRNNGHLSDFLKAYKTDEYTEERETDGLID